MTQLQARQQQTVLVIEDEASDRFPLERAFHQLGPEFSLQVVETGQAAVAYLEGKAPYSDRSQFPLPALIVLDLRLPGMSGLDLLKWIREQSQFKDLPIITLTAYGNRDLPRAYELGINFYLLKPAEADSLAEILQAIGLYQR
ncbi:response regulator [Phormidium sp. FACHB-592]|uniref:Response regulator n=1 Tax=Stenomitos frigidus AS-A4 TaxID=2933935 RepID=A0ABV0KL92_9CYAN|nr:MULTISPECIES: response regulator [Cyanophyceae]MBD2034940.1 response regulator [Leptolyngbya sp. FACHB-321]MBD2073228.1 response regulator [Phormidium sp. FACHB-592]